MEKLKKPASGIVHVTLPHELAYDLHAIQKIQASILDKLGCAACCSGHDIRFDFGRRFIVDKALNIKEEIR